MQLHEQLSSLAGFGRSIRPYPHRPPIQRACRDFSACGTQAEADLLKADRLKDI
jgi:hypothetical protein